MTPGLLPQRPVVRTDGMIGIAECRKHGYTIWWADGTETVCVDISYVGARFSDLPYTPPTQSVSEKEVKR